MPSDSKKVQTMINVLADNVAIMRNAMETIKTVRTAFTNANPDVTGTALDGNVTAVNNGINSLDTELSKGLWDAVIAARVSSHEGRALDG